MILNFKSYGSGTPLIILHGLMGSLDNWQLIAKKLGERYHVFTLDLRNHGRSPHSDVMTYTAMIDDLKEFITLQQLTRADIIGHSMGGKVAMSFALAAPAMVDRLIVVDIAPGAYEDRHASVFRALYAVDLAQLTGRPQAEATLRQYIHDESTVQFLMKSLYRDDALHFQWRFNLPVLHEAYYAISAQVEPTGTFAGKTLFIKGAKSDYISASNYGAIVDMFPDHQLTEIADAGHWVHADQPAQFISAVEEFLG